MQIGVDQIVLAVHLITGGLVRLGRLHGGKVGRDQVLPETDAREDVRRHVLCMRRSRRDLGVTPGGVDPPLRERRSVVEVNEIMSDARVPGVALEDWLQDGRSLELIGVSLVGRRGRDVQRNRVEDLRLVVVGIFCRQCLHRLEIGLNARLMSGLVVVDIHDRQSVDVVALALRLGARGLRRLNGGKAERQVGRRRRVVRIVE